MCGVTASVLPKKSSLPTASELLGNCVWQTYSLKASWCLSQSGRTSFRSFFVGNRLCFAPVLCPPLHAVLKDRHQALHVRHCDVLVHGAQGLCLDSGCFTYLALQKSWDFFRICRCHMWHMWRKWGLLISNHRLASTQSISKKSTSRCHFNESHPQHHNHP